MKDEDVNGQVIGNIETVGQVFYENRPQGPQLYANDSIELRGYAEKAISRFKHECGDAVNLIYPNESAWELRIYQ